MPILSAVVPYSLLRIQLLFSLLHIIFKCYMIINGLSSLLIISLNDARLFYDSPLVLTLNPLEVSGLVLSIIFLIIILIFRDLLYI